MVKSIFDNVFGDGSVFLLLLSERKQILLFLLKQAIRTKVIGGNDPFVFVKFLIT